MTDTPINRKKTPVRGGDLPASDISQVPACGKRPVWRGFTVEHQHLPPMEMEPWFAGHPSVDLVLSPPMTLEMNKGGKWINHRTMEGDLYLVSSGTPCNRIRWQNENTEILSICLETAFLAEAAREMSLRRDTELRPLLGFQDVQVKRIALCLKAEAEAGCPGGRLLGESLATALAGHLLTHYAVSDKKLPGHSTGLSEKDIKKVTDYLQDNLADDVSLTTLAGVLSISPYYFCRLFKRSTGFSPHQYVIEKRVARAKQLLARGNVSVLQAALEVGFYSESHLTRHMKKRHGILPSEIVRRQQKRRLI